MFYLLRGNVLKCESCGREVKKYKRIPLKDEEEGSEGSIVCEECYYAIMTEYVDLVEGQ